MKKVGVFEGKTHFSALIEDVRNGETIIVTKNGQPVAQIALVSPSLEPEPAAASAMKRILSSKATLGPKLTVRDLINEDRRN